MDHEEKLRAGIHVILGAGPVGRALAERLTVDGRAVRVVTRSGRADVPRGVEVVAADVTDAGAAASACSGAGIIYGCLGLPGYQRWAELWPLLMEGMLHAAETSGAPFVFMDNLYMYGPVDGPLTEDLPLTDYGEKPTVRSRITRQWQEAHAAGRVRAAAVRASDFYGPGVTEAMLGESSVGALARGKAAQVIGSVDLPHSFCYVPDIARALLSVGEAGDEVLGQAWHVPNAPDRTVRQHLTAFAEEFGTPLRIQAASRWMLTLLGLFNPVLREMKELLYQWERPFQVDHSKFAARFWNDPTPFAEGIPATAEWYRAR